MAQLCTSSSCPLPHTHTHVTRARSSSTSRASPRPTTRSLPARSATAGASRKACSSARSSERAAGPGARRAAARAARAEAALGRAGCPPRPRLAVARLAAIANVPPARPPTLLSGPSPTRPPPLTPQGQGRDAWPGGGGRPQGPGGAADPVDRHTDRAREARSGAIRSGAIRRDLARSRLDPAARLPQPPLHPPPRAPRRELPIPAPQNFSQTCQVDVKCEHPYFLNPLLAACQLVNVARPGEEPKDLYAAQEDCRWGAVFAYWRCAVPMLRFGGGGSVCGNEGGEPPLQRPVRGAGGLQWGGGGGFRIPVLATGHGPRHGPGGCRTAPRAAYLGGRVAAAQQAAARRGATERRARAAAFQAKRRGREQRMRSGAANRNRNLENPPAGCCTPSWWARTASPCRPSGAASGATSPPMWRTLS